MKKIIIILILIIIVPAAVSAVEVMAGAKTGYFLWRPYYKDFEQSGTGDITVGSGILYGPVISIIFNPKWSLSASGLFGIQSSQWHLNDEKMNWGPEEITANSTWYAKTRRMDMDLALSYRLSDNFRVYAGYKYQLMETEYHATYIGEQSNSDQFADHGEAVLKSPAHGPAIGAGYSKILNSNLFFTSNISILYMFSYVEWTKSDWTIYTPDGPDSFSEFVFSQDKHKLDTYQIGFNFEPSFGASLGHNLIMTLGGRFQWMAVKFIDDPLIDGADVAPKSGMDDIIYGGFLSIIYSF